MTHVNKFTLLEKGGALNNDTNDTFNVLSCL